MQGEGRLHIPIYSGSRNVGTETFYCLISRIYVASSHNIPRYAILMLLTYTRSVSLKKILTQSL